MQMLLNAPNNRKLASFLLLSSLLVIGALPKYASAFGTKDLLFWESLVPFTVQVEGDAQLKTQLEEELKKQRQSDPLFDAKARRKKIARNEVELLRTILESEGFYNHQVKFLVEDKNIIYHVKTGIRFRIESIELNHPSTIDIPHTVLPIKQGDFINAKSVLSARKTLHEYIESKYCLFHIRTHYSVKIDRETHQAYVSFTLENSPNVLFGAISFSGLSTIEEAFFRKIIDLQPETCFKRKKLDEIRISLLQSNLVARVDVAISEPSNGVSDIEFKITERNHRTISAGIGYDSSEGAGISLGWTHRNFSGKAEKFEIDTHVAEHAQTIATSITLPHFKKKNQQITFYSQYERENTDAFESKSGSVGSEISRQLHRNLRLLIGADLTFSEVEEDDVTNSFALISSPLTLEYDKRTDPLNPTKGWVAAASVRPYWDAKEPDTRFVKSTLAASGYHTFDRMKYQPTLAVRTAMGTITGIERDGVPANIRFFVGGGGSVRGYPYQSLGPSLENDKGGGLSFTEVSFEARFRANEHWGYVVFLDGGLAFKEASPEVNEELLWGTGFGVRYFTGFVPIRVDFAFPLDKREDVDDDYQFYISIGQAF